MKATITLFSVTTVCCTLPIGLPTELGFSDKMGNFIKNIHIKRLTPHLFTVEMSGKVNPVGTVGQVAFSPDRAQKYLYVADGGDDVVWTVDRASGQVLPASDGPVT